MAKKMSLDDFLYSKGVDAPFSDYIFDKLRSNRQIRTARGKKRFEAACEKHRVEYAEKRQKAIDEYYSLVENGEIVQKTRLEITVEKANGHPDNESTQAARRILAKRGIDWRTGKPFGNNAENRKRSSLLNYGKGLSKGNEEGV